MVFTHVLMLPLSRLTEVPTLGPVLDLLLSEPPDLAHRPSTLAPIPWTPPANTPIYQSDEVPASWLAVLQQLLDGSAPVFAVGEPDRFRVLLEALWQGLPATLRATLSWGVRFAPPRDGEAVPLLVQVPLKVERKWQDKQTVQLGTAERVVPELPAEQLISGAAEGGRFRNFLSAVEVTLQSFEELKRCQRAFQQYSNLQAGSAGSGELLSFIRTLRLLQPDPTKGSSIKHRAVDSLAEALVSEGRVATEAMALRGVPLEAFQTGVARLGGAVGAVVERLVAVVDSDPALPSTLLKHLAEPDPTKIEGWWREAAAAAFSRSLTASPKAAAKVIWLGLTDTENVREFVLQVVPNEAPWEELLTKTIPVALSAPAADAVTQLCAGWHWWDLFAAAVGVAYAPADALLKQVRAEKKLGLDKSPRVAQLAKRVVGTELVRLAVQEATPQLLNLAGARCGEDACLLAPMDVRQKSWRLVWSVSLEHSKSLTAGLRNPSEMINAFLSEVALGRADERLPLELTATSAYANVLHLPERAQLWSKLPTKLRSRFVALTLDALVEQLIEGNESGEVQDLQAYAQEEAFNTKFLYQKRQDLSAVLTVNSVLNNLTDRYLQDYIRNLPTTTQVAAVQVGKLIQKRNWDNSANALLTRAMYDTVFRPGLQECASMFNKITRLLNYRVFDQKVTSSEAWQALTDCMIELYPKGPDHEHIWQRAGGDVTLLNDRQNRREQWASAIVLLQRGGGGKHIIVKSLIDSALEDFKHNSTLLALRDLLHLL